MRAATRIMTPCAPGKGEIRRTSDSVDGKNSRTGAVDGIDQAETETAIKLPNGRPGEKKVKSFPIKRSGKRQ